MSVFVYLLLAFVATCKHCTLHIAHIVQHIYCMSLDHFVLTFAANNECFLKIKMQI